MKSANTSPQIEVMTLTLNERKKRILQAIIQDYITSAEPVGSRTIARKYDLGVGAATIRNEMFDLEMLGFLEQPHTSAGRIPSVKGYRFYVDCLLEPTAVAPAERKMVEEWFHYKVSGVDQIFQSMAKVLAQMTHNAIFVMASQQVQAKLKYVRFLPLDDRRAIMIVVTDSGHIENCLFDRPEGVSLDELNHIAERLTCCLAGKALGQMDVDFLNRFRETVVDDLELYRTAFQTLHRAFQREHQVYKGGTLELFDKPEFKDVHKAKNLVTLLEEQEVVSGLFGNDGQDKVTVRIGDEIKLQPITDCSIIEATFTAGNAVVGKIAVLGPTRMEYARIIGLLHFMQQHIKQILEHYEDKP